MAHSHTNKLKLIEERMTNWLLLTGRAVKAVLRGLWYSWDLNGKVVNHAEIMGKRFPGKGKSGRRECKDPNMGVSLACWMDLVTNEQIEEMFVHAVLSV